MRSRWEGVLAADQSRVAEGSVSKDANVMKDERDLMNSVDECRAWRKRTKVVTKGVLRSWPWMVVLKSVLRM